jgi:hypothetical protein
MPRDFHNATTMNNTTSIATGNTDSYEQAGIFGWVFAFLGLGMVFGNGLAIAGLSRCTRLLDQMRVLLMSLAVTDLLTGLAHMADVTRYGSDSLASMHIIPCKIRLHVSTSLQLVSYLTLAAVTVDRVMALYFGIRYLIYITKMRVVAAASCMWLLGAGLTFYAYEDGFQDYSTCSFLNVASNMSLLTLAVTYTVCMVIICFGYSVIFHIVRRHRRQVRAAIPGLPGDMLSAYVSANFRSSITSAYFVVTFVVFYMPVYVVLWCIFINPDSREMFDYKIFNGCVALALLNALVNPILYAWRLSECRVRVILMVCRCNTHITTVAIETLASLQ